MTTITATVVGGRLEVKVPTDWPDGAQVVIRPVVQQHIKQHFDQLVGQWKEETRFFSSIHDMVSHPAYLQIIGMGTEALPFLFDELRREPDHWFVALQAITGMNPVPPAARGDVDKMSQAWLAWAGQYRP